MRADRRWRGTYTSGSRSDARHDDAIRKKSFRRVRESLEFRVQRIDEGIRTIQKVDVIQESSLSSIRWRYLLLIAVVVAAVYGQSAGFHFIHYDDDELVYRNEQFLSDWGSIFKAFTTHAFVGGGGESVYYRPILLLTFIGEYHLWGLAPAAYHLDNVLFHLLATLLFFWLAEALTGNSLTALFAALLFALHPVQTESVAWVAGRNDVLLGIFILLTILFYVLASRDDRRRTLYRTLSILAFGLALFTKESAAFYLLLLPLFDLCIGGFGLRELATRRRLGNYAPYAALLVGYLFVRLAIFGAFIGAERLYGHTPLLDRMLTSPAILAEHLRLLLIPAGLSVAHPVDGLFWDRWPWKIAAVVVVLLLPAAIGWSWRRDRVVSFGLLWTAVGFLPLTNFIPVAIPILEHRLYVPIAGFALAIAQGAFAVGVHRRRAAIAALAAVVLLLAGISFLRLPVWRTGTDLFRDAVEKAPTDLRSYFSLAQASYESNDYPQSVHWLREYLDRDSTDVRPYLLLREVYYVQNQNNRVAEICRRLIELEPGNPRRYLEAGVIYEEMNRFDTAVAYYRRGLSMDAQDAELHLRMGVVEARLGNAEEAVPQLLASLSVDSTSEEAYLVLAKVYAARGRADAAIVLLQRGLSILPGSRTLAGVLKDLYLRTGHQREAEMIDRRFKF